MQGHDSAIFLWADVQQSILRGSYLEVATNIKSICASCRPAASMYACLQGLITQPAAVPIQMLSTFSRMGAVRPWVGALAVQQRALATGRARAERGPSAPSSMSAAAAAEASVGPVHAVDDLTGLPSTAYGRVMSSQANYFRVRLHGTREGAGEVPDVRLLLLTICGHRRYRRLGRVLAVYWSCTARRS